jgi:hypothetical protein
VSTAPTSFADWQPALLDLCGSIRAALRTALCTRTPAELAHVAGRGAGDVTFGLDVPAEAAVERWLAEHAARAPLSLCTEDAGWRHRGPDGAGGVRALAQPDPRAARILIDPIDGTRNLMADLRSAWTVVAFAPSGPRAARLADVTGGIVAEIPAPGGARARTLWAASVGPCNIAEEDAGGRGVGPSRALAADADDRPDRGYFPFFHYEPASRPRLAELQAEFFARLEREEGADPRACWDDQYISNAGQLVLLALGTYRMVIDARAHLARRAGAAWTTSKPYDVAGAIVVARAAGCAITRADGGELDFPLDATTSVDFAGYHNASTRARLERHWLATLQGN